MPEVATRILGNTPIIGSFAGVLVAVVCLWSARWGRRLLLLTVSGTAMISMLAAGFLFLGEPARNVELGTWLAVGSEPEARVLLTYRLDKIVVIVLTAVAFCVLGLEFMESTNKPSKKRTISTLWWAFVFTAAAQFVLSSNPVIRFACWQLLGIAGVLWPVVATPEGVNRMTAVLSSIPYRLAGDGCILLAIAASTQPALAQSHVVEVLLSLGVLTRFLCRSPQVTDTARRNPDRWLIAPLGFLWLRPASSFGELLLLATILVAAIVVIVQWMARAHDRRAVSDQVGAVELARPPSRAKRLWDLFANVLNAFEAHVIHGATTAVANLPRRLSDAGEPVRGQSARFYFAALVLATFALLLGVVGWRVAS